MRCEACTCEIVNVDKYCKMYLFKNDVGGITYVLGIVMIYVCLFKCIITTFWARPVDLVCQQSSTSDASSTSDLSGGRATFDRLMSAKGAWSSGNPLNIWIENENYNEKLQFAPTIRPIKNCCVALPRPTLNFEKSGQLFFFFVVLFCFLLTIIFKNFDV